MIAKFVLVVVIGAGHAQSVSFNTYDSQAECEAVGKAIVEKFYPDGTGGFLQGNAGWECKPYTFEQN